MGLEEEGVVMEAKLVTEPQLSTVEAKRKMNHTMHTGGCGNYLFAPPILLASTTSLIHTVIIAQLLHSISLLILQ